ncbi:hypothetical protein L0337_38755 [candidate division KSB1 bacterium]|nr:hypothetical protein [candidate division KSB1 bacterium]
MKTEILDDVLARLPADALRGLVHKLIARLENRGEVSGLINERDSLREKLELVIQERDALKKRHTAVCRANHKLQTEYAKEVI